jgi:hypothetical protein
MALGDCYRAAARLILDNDLPPEARLAHGMVDGQGPLTGCRFGHAWVELGDVVLDHLNGRTIAVRAEEYYRIGRMREEEIKRYTREETARLVLKHEHWGPWSGEGAR